MAFERISMRDIAAKAGVSVMTVSLALRNSPRLSAETRKKVQSIAKKMGFKPDPVLQALVSYRAGKKEKSFAGVIAYINNTRQASIVSGADLNCKFFSGATKGASALGYKVEEFWLNKPGLSPQRAADVLRARGIQGLLLGPQEKPNTVIQGFDWSDFSVVTYGFSLEFPRFNVVANETFKAMLLCMTHLHKLGYQRPGLSISSDQDLRTQNRYSGAYLAAWPEFSKRSAAPPVHQYDAQAPLEFQKWVKKYRPDVIIGPGERMLHLLNSFNYRVPEDIGLASPFEGQNTLPLAHADGRPEEAGRIAAGLVSSMISQNEKGVPDSPRTITIDPVWVSGPTLRSH